MISAVLFDFRDTLLKVDYAYKKANLFLWKFLENKGIGINFQDFEVKLKKSINRIKKEYENDTKIHNWNILFLKDLFNSLDLKIPKNDVLILLEKYDEIFVQNVKLFHDAKFILDFLKKNNIRMGVVIDGTSKRERSMIKRLKLERYLGIIIISEEVGKNKFSTKPLEEALKKLGIPAQKVAVVGDRIDKDIANANKLDCISIKLERSKGRYTNVKHVKAEEEPNFVIKNLRELVNINQCIE